MKNLVKHSNRQNEFSDLSASGCRKAIFSGPGRYAVWYISGVLKMDHEPMTQLRFLPVPGVAVMVALVAGLVACGAGDQGLDTGPGDEGADVGGDVADVVGDAADADPDSGFEWPEGMSPVAEPADPVLAGGLPAGTAFDRSNRPVLDLSGTWQFKFDDADVGVTDGWFGTAFDRGKWRTTPVPGTWDMDLADGFDR